MKLSSQNIKNKLREYFQTRKNIDMAYLFGSVLKRENFNDIDIAVLLNKEVPAKMHIDIKLAFIGEIMDLTGFNNVDMVILNKLDDPLLAYQIVSKGEVLYKKKPFIDTGFKAKTTSVYFDFQHFLNRQYDLLVKNYDR